MTSQVQILCALFDHLDRRLALDADEIEASAARCAERCARASLIVAAALRFFRACLAKTDEFFNRYLVKHDLFLPVLELAQEEAGRDNLLSSACLDFFEFLRVVRSLTAYRLAHALRPTSRPSSTTCATSIEIA